MLEVLCVKFKVRNINYFSINAYRPPQSPLHDDTEIVDSLLSFLCHQYENIICLVDLNVDLLKYNNLLRSCSHSYNFTSLVG